MRMAQSRDAASYLARLNRIQQQMPEKYHEALWELTGAGKSPDSVAAAVEYVETRKTQKEVASEFDASRMSIRTMVRELVDRGVIERGDIRGFGNVEAP